MNERKEYSKEYYLKNKDKIKEYAENNKDKIKKYKKEWHEKNKEEIKTKRSEYFRKYRETKRLEINDKARNNYKNNKSKISERNKKYRKENTWTKLRYNISSRINHQIRDKNYEHCFDILGYSVEDLMNHLESLFKPGMSWDNYGRNGWHIDHIIPVSHFKTKYKSDLKFKICWSLKNLQPLWAKENLEKYNKILGEVKKDDIK